jgi:hypothetical protein
VFLSHLKRNACASTVIRQWPKFPSKEVSCRDETQEDMVAIHQPVLKSTTSATGWFIWFVWFVSFIWLNKTNKMNQTDEIDQIDSELPLSLTLGYSHN